MNLSSKHSAIRCKGIKKYYGTNDNRVEALKGIDLEINQGELTLLVGPSGSGKTTLLSIISSILTPDEGQLFLMDKDIAIMSEKEKAAFCRGHLGIVFQSYFLVPTLSLAENVSLPLLIGGHEYETALEKSIGILKQLNIDHHFDASPAILSKGQQQRVAIARAMINDAAIILCDEPTSSLDLVAGTQVMSLLHDFAKKLSKTVLVVTHDQRIFPYADRIITINDGQIIR